MQRRHSLDSLEPRVVLNADAIDDELYAAQDTALSIAVEDLTGNDVDAVEMTAFDGQTTAGGTVTLDPQGALQYEPVSGFYGDDTFTYTIRDAEDNEDTATVTIHVEQTPAGNQDPYFIDNGDVEFSIDQDAVLTGQLPGAVDPDNDELLYAEELYIEGVQALHGTVEVNTDGSFTYTPDAGYVGDDSFMYAVDDYAGGVIWGTVTIHVAEPEPTNQDFSLDGAEMTATIWADETWNFVPQDYVSDDPDGDVTYTVGVPTFGTISDDGIGTYTYSSEGQTGTVQFVVYFTDGEFSHDLTVVLDVLPTEVLNHDFTLLQTEDDVTITEDQTWTFRPLDNIFEDLDGDVGYVLEEPSFGSIIDNGDGSYTFSPDGGDGDATLVVRYGDGLHEQIQTITIHVTPVNHDFTTAPKHGHEFWVSPGDTFTFNPADYLLTDVDGDVQVHVTKNHGTLTDNGDGTWQLTFDNHRQVKITLRFEDGLHERIVELVVASNTAPTLMPNQGLWLDARMAAYADPEGFPVGLQLMEFLHHDGTAANIDEDGGPDSLSYPQGMAIVGLTTGEAGTWQYSITSNQPTWLNLTTASESNAFLLMLVARLRFVSNGLAATETPSLVFRVWDGVDQISQKNATRVDLTELTGGVYPFSVDTAELRANLVPVVGSASYTVPDDDEPFTAALPTIGSSDGDPLTYELLSGPGPGAITFNGDGTFTYEPMTGMPGTYSFTYRVNDGRADSNIGTITLQVAAQNDAPQNNLPSAVDVPIGGSVVFSTENGNAVSITDDSIEELQVLLTVDHGTLSLGNPVMVTLLTGTGTNDWFVCLRGPVYAVNSALEGLVYHAAPGYSGPVRLSMAVQDFGGGGSGGPKADFDVLTFRALPTLSVTAPPTVKETAGTVTFTVTLSCASTETITVNYGTSNATAQAGEDYTAVTGQLVFSPGASLTQTVTVALINDALVEGNETFSLQLSSPDGALLAATATVVTVVSDDVPVINHAPTFTKGANQTFNEDSGAVTIGGWATNISAGSANESGQTLNFIVTNNNPSLFSVPPTLSADGTLTFTAAANASGSATVTVVLHDDGGTAYGGVDASVPQTFVITINPVNDAPTFTKGTDVAALMNGGQQVVSGWATNVAAGPASEAGQTLTFTVVADHPELFTTTGQPQIVWNATTGKYDLRYTPILNAFGMAALTVTLNDNGGTANGGVNASAPQTFALVISPFGDGGGSAGGGGGSAEIAAMPQVGLAKTQYNVTEGAQSNKAQLTVLLSRPTDHAVTVHWYVSSDTAYAGVDTQQSSGTLTFAAGQVQKTIEIDLVDDSIERDHTRTFNVVLAGAEGAELAAGYDEAAVELTDDDVTLSIIGEGTTEGFDLQGNPNTINFVVFLSRAHSDAITVNYTVGGPGAGDLVSSAGGSLTFAAGQTYKFISLPVSNDDNWTTHPLYSDIRMGEPTRSVIITITCDDPQVMIGTPTAAANIFDDDWQQEMYVFGEYEEPVEQWFDPLDYAPGDVILVPIELNGFGSFTVPLNWQGADFWVYETVEGFHYEWQSIASTGEYEAYIGVQRIGSGSINEAGNATAKFRVHVSGIDGNTGTGIGASLQYKILGLTAQSGVDFEALTGTIGFSQDGYQDIEVSIPSDGLTEPLEGFAFVVTDVVGAVISGAMSVAVDIAADPHVVKLEFQQAYTAGEPSVPIGDLREETQRYRFFPDQQLDANGQIIAGPTNVVRVHALVHNLTTGDLVYFAAFDVDDPMQTGTEVDNDTADPAHAGEFLRKGNDNLGRLDVNSPNAPSGVGGPNDGGFSGLVRSLPNQGLPTAWNAATGNRKYAVAVGKVYQGVDGLYYADVELAVSFQPGDNFRVVAMPERDKNDTGQTIPQYVYDAFDALNFADEHFPEKVLDETDMRTTPVLTVWRKLHVEIDGMQDDDSLGDRYDTYDGVSNGLAVVAAPTAVPNQQNRWTMEVVSDAAIAKNALEGGWFAAANGQFRQIATNEASIAENGKYRTVVVFVGAATTTAVNDLVTLYEDDFEVVGAEGNQTIQQRVNMDDSGNPQSALRQALTQYLQPTDGNAMRDRSADPRYNRLASAFIEAVYDLPSGAALAAQNHLSDDHVGDGFDNAALNNDLFWVSYAALAYQRGGTTSDAPLNADLDADRWVDGVDKFVLGDTADYEKRSGLGSTPGFTIYAGGEQMTIVNNYSALFLEQVFDAHMANVGEGGTFASSWLDQLARVFVQHIGHQFQLEHPKTPNLNPNPNNPGPTVDDEVAIDGIMTVGTERVPTAQFAFTPQQILTLRQNTKPGTELPSSQNT